MEQVLYVWEKEVEAIKDWVITFKDGSEIKLTAKQLDYMVTKEPLDEAQLKNVVLENVAKDVLNIFQEHNIRKGDLSPIIETVVSSFNQNFLIAVGKAFGTYTEWKYPMQCQEDITMEDIIQMKDK